MKPIRIFGFLIFAIVAVSSTSHAGEPQGPGSNVSEPSEHNASIQVRLDHWIEKAIRRGWAKRPGVPAERLQLSVVDGVAHVQGRVKSRRLRNLIVKIADRGATAVVQSWKSKKTASGSKDALEQGREMWKPATDRRRPRLENEWGFLAD